MITGTPDSGGSQDEYARAFCRDKHPAFKVPGEQGPPQEVTGHTCCLRYCVRWSDWSDLPRVLPVLVATDDVRLLRQNCQADTYLLGFTRGHTYVSPPLPQILTPP